MENRENARFERLTRRQIRKHRQEREWRRKRRYRVILFRRTAAAVILIGIIVAVVLLFRGLLTNEPTVVPQDGTADSSVTASKIIHREVLHDTPETDGMKAPFNQMSTDWSGNDLNGWWRYTIPDEYSRTGGYLPDLVQVFTFCLCKGNNIRYSLVLALIEAESGYHYDAVSAANDIGYMQVNYKWHMDKMEGMKEKALYNPYVNIRIGIEYLSELQEIFSTEAGMLTGYKYGPGGAMSRCFNDRTITSPYAEQIIARADEIDEELEARRKLMTRFNEEDENAE